MHAAFAAIDFLSDGLNPAESLYKGAFRFIVHEQQLTPPHNKHNNYFSQKGIDVARMFGQKVPTPTKDCIPQICRVGVFGYGPREA